MSGGGIIIMRSAIRQALTNPIVRGSLPARIAKKISPFIDTDENNWTQDQQDDAQHAFNWYMSTYC